MRMTQSHLRLLFIVLTPILSSSHPLGAVHQADSIMINVTRQEQVLTDGITGTGTEYLNGYRKTVGGQILPYHSCHPDAGAALLVRARRDAGSISWETDTLPRVWNDKFYRLIWLAGIEKEGWKQSTREHTFDVLIDGRHWFTFTNRKDSTAHRWNIPGKEGAELSFESLMIDRFGDLFGMMMLLIPRTACTPGKPLTITITGEDAESPDWYMTFQYHFLFVPSLRPESAVLRMENGVSAQTLRVSLDNLVADRTIAITMPGKSPVSKPLEIGANIFTLPVDAVTSPVEVPVVFMIDDTVMNRSALNLKPVPYRDVYLLSYSHNDIGYTDLQPDVERKQWRNIDEALRLIERTRQYPSEAQYKWNIETLWAFESYLRQASAVKRMAVLDAVRGGSIGVNALYTNLLTGLTNDVEISHATDFARRLTTEYSIPVTTAVISDIPGFTWGVVPTLAHSGVKYFSSAPNAFDRVGRVYEGLGDKPFYWMSQSGEERILLWLTSTSYSMFHEGELGRLGDQKIFKIMRNLDAQQYPFDIVQLPYTLGDNGPTDSTLSDAVRDWNRRYVSPRLIIATHEQMFRAFEERYGKILPTMKGDFTPYWEDGAASTARETALNRRSADRLIQSEALWSMRDPGTFPASDDSLAWWNVMMFDEHTWGADVSVSHPDSPFVLAQWRIKENFALDADRQSRKLFDGALGFRQAPRGKDRVIDIYNTLSWTRSDLIVLSDDQSGGAGTVLDDQGRIVPSQILSDGEFAFLATDVPPLGARRYFLRQGGARQHPHEPSAGGSSLENSVFALTVNEFTGAIASLLWKKTGAQLVDRSKEAGLNTFLYVPGRNAGSVVSLSNVRIHMKETGPIVTTLLVEADAPGCRQYATEIRIIEGMERIDIVNMINKAAVRTKEGLHFAFPFNIPGGRLRYDVAWGVVEPGRDQLPGACKNFFSVQRWVDVSNEDGGVTWATADAPLLEIGGINAEKPWLSVIEPSTVFYSYVMNNYWHTNYKAEQEGTVSFRYGIRPHGRFDPADSYRFGKEIREPLIAAPASPNLPPSSSLMLIDPPVVVVSSIKPIEGGHAWWVQLYNPSAEQRHVGVIWRADSRVRFYESDLFQRTGSECGSRLTLSPFGIFMIKVVPDL